MKVRELIERLRDVDPEAEVVVQIAWLEIRPLGEVGSFLPGDPLGPWSEPVMKYSREGRPVVVLEA